MKSLAPECAHCGQPLPANAPHGHCPTCLARALAGVSDAPAVGDSVADERASAAACESSGIRVRGYRLIEELGRGGMGIVYKAWQPGAERFVALKVLNAGIAPPGAAMERFLREARLIAGLEHPGIVRLYEVGSDDGHPFFSMELVEGQSLDAWARRGPLPARQAAQCLLKLAQAVAYAHEHRIIHRDLKPSNVILSRDGEPRITDFGLARRFDAWPQLTLTGQLLGTPSYLAPEQLRKERQPLDPRGDLYSLGATLYHLLAGCPPFQAETIEAVLLQIATDDPVSLRRLNPSVSPDLEAICFKCLQKKPSYRYASALALIEDLERFLDGQPTAARPVTALQWAWGRCRRHPWASALGAALVAVALGGSALVLAEWRVAVTARQETEGANRQLRQQLNRERLARAADRVERGSPTAALPLFARVLRDDPQNRVAAARIVDLLTRQNFALPLGAPILTGTGLNAAVVAPDGQSVAVASAGQFARIFELKRGSPVTPPLRHDGSVLRVAFSPGGRRLASASPDGTARIWDAHSGDLLFPPLRHAGSVQRLTFSPDGAWLATTSEGRGDDRRHWVSLWDTASGRLRHTLITNRYFFLAVGFSPDGRRLAAGSTDRRLYIWDTESGRLSGKLDQGGAVTCLAYSPDGGLLAAGTAGGEARLWNARTLAPIGTPFRHSGGVASIAFSPDGQGLLTACQDGQVRVFDVATGRVRFAPLVAAGALREAAYDNQGTRIITAGESGAAFVWDAQTGLAWCAPLPHSAPVQLARFTPDGTRIVTVTDQGTIQVWNGLSGTLRPVRRQLPTAPLAGIFTPNGAELRFVMPQPSLLCWRWSAEKAPIEIPLLNEKVRSAAFNPDGSQVLLEHPSGWALWDFTAGRTLARGISTEVGEVAVAFAPNGHSLAANRLDHFVEVYDTRTGHALPARLKTNSRSQVNCLRFSADGRFLFVGEYQDHGRVWEFQTDRLVLDLHPFVAPGATQFSPDGTRLASSAPDGTVRLYELPTGRSVSPGLMHPGTVREVRFSHDGRHLVTLAADNALRVWDVASGRMLLPPMRHHGEVLQAEVSADDRSLLTVSADRTVAVWDLVTGQPRFDLIGFDGRIVWVQFLGEGDNWTQVTDLGKAEVRDTITGHIVWGPLQSDGHFQSAVLSPDEHSLLIGTTGGTILVWDLLLPKSHAPPWLAPLAEAVVGEFLDADGLPMPVPTASAYALESELARLAGSDAFSQWVRWFGADWAARPRSPYSH